MKTNDSIELEKLQEQLAFMTKMTESAPPTDGIHAECFAIQTRIHELMNPPTFGDWLEEVEVKDVSALVTHGAPDSVECVPGHRTDEGRLVNAVWDDKNPGNHKCHACFGTGIWHLPHYARRGQSGPCHKCKGRGHFKASSTERAKSREYRRLTTAKKLGSKQEEFMKDHEALMVWLADNVSWNNFARSMCEAFNKYGSLTDPQRFASENMMVKCLAKQEAREAAKPASDADALDLTDLPAGRYAVPGGTRLKLQVKKPDGRSNWEGWIFVSDGAEYGYAKKYGRQGPGKKYTGEVVEELKIIMEDPEAASRAYGKLVGCCGVCGRKLEDEKSVAAGIGPICEAKMGWLE